MSSEIVQDVDPTAVETIRERFGEIAAREYGAMYLARRNEVDAKIKQLEEANDEDFVEFASWAILESARMNSYNGNYDDLHVVATIAHQLSNSRSEGKGQSPNCSQHSLYHQGWVRAYRSQGHHYDRGDDGCSCEVSSP